MNVLLLANVGNSDLRLERPDLLPTHDDPDWWRSIRRQGEEINQNFDRYGDALTLPLLGPTVRWILDNEGVAGSDLHVVLFASNQAYHPTIEHEWLRDTLPVAKVIRQVLSRPPYGIPKKQIHTEAIDGIPADYSNMLSFYARTLPERQRYVDADTRVYLEVSGGTPAMTSMLIVMGVEVFGESVRTLYVDRGATVPYEVNVSRELFARKSRDVLRNQIALYAYAVAQRTLEASGALITSDSGQRELMHKLLTYADRRLAFDFKRALDALQEARKRALGVQQAQIQHWLRELEEPDAASNLAELIHSTRIKQFFGDYADFVQRIFRFQEAAFRHMAERMGLQYTKSDGQYASQNWLESVPGLGKFLDMYRNRQTGRVNTIDLSRPLNRVSLGAIVDYFVQNVPEWSHWQGVADQLHALSAVADLRNSGLAGHGFRGIGETDIEDAFGGTAADLLACLTTIYETIFEDAPGDDPYAAVNALLDAIVQG